MILSLARSIFYTWINSERTISHRTMIDYFSKWSVKSRLKSVKCGMLKTMIALNGLKQFYRLNKMEIRDTQIVWTNRIWFACDDDHDDVNLKMRKSIHTNRFNDHDHHFSLSASWRTSTVRCIFLFYRGTASCCAFIASRTFNCLLAAQKFSCCDRNNNGVNAKRNNNKQKTNCNCNRLVWSERELCVHGTWMRGDCTLTRVSRSQCTRMQPNTEQISNLFFHSIFISSSMFTYCLQSLNESTKLCLCMSQTKKTGNENKLNSLLAFHRTKTFHCALCRLCCH